MEQLLPKGACLDWNPLLVWGISSSELLFAFSLLFLGGVYFKRTFLARKEKLAQMRLVMALFDVALGLVFLTKYLSMWFPSFFWLSLGTDFIAAPTAVICVWYTVKEKNGVEHGPGNS